MTHARARARSLTIAGPIVHSGLASGVAMAYSVLPAGVSHTMTSTGGASSSVVFTAPSARPHPNADVDQTVAPVDGSTEMTCSPEDDSAAT